MTEKQIITTITAFGFTANPKDEKVYSKTYDKLNTKCLLTLPKAN